MTGRSNRNILRRLSFIPPWTFSILVLAGIIWLTLGQPPSPPDDIQLWEHTDKIVHAVMFGTLFLAMSLDWYRRHPSQKIYFSSLPLAIIFPWVLVIGASIELIQPEFQRSCDFWDFLADTAGAVVAWLIAPPILRALSK